MQVIERQVEGYSQQQLAGFCGNICYLSPSRQAFARVRGICFAAGHESPRLAEEFITAYLKLGFFSLRTQAMTADSWPGVSTLLSGKQTRMANVGILLNTIDLIVPGMEQVIAETVDKVVTVGWYATLGNPQMIHPRLSLPFLVYLGLGQTGRMRYLLQDGQKLVIDKGSLKRSDN